MAAPTGTQQLPQEKYAEELNDLDEGMSGLQVLYEKYFLGIDRKPPDQERKRISEKARELRTTSIRNTALKFKVNTLFAKLISFERMWDRTLREIEDGTYKRDLFKAKLRAGDRDEPRTGPVKPAAPSISDANLRRLYDTYLVARKRCGAHPLPGSGADAEAQGQEHRVQGRDQGRQGDSEGRPPHIKTRMTSACSARSAVDLKTFQREP